MPKKLPRTGSKRPGEAIANEHRVALHKISEAASYRATERGKVVMAAIRTHRPDLSKLSFSAKDYRVSTPTGLMILSEPRH